MKNLETNLETNKKIINNAISAYFMLFICISFVFAKNNKLLYNPFVKIHAKTAFIIHLLFLLVYIIFINFALWSSIRILQFSLNHIIASVLFIWLFWFLLFWAYRAYRWKTMTMWEVLSSKWFKDKFTVNVKTVAKEEEKLTLILAYIPFIWYIIYGKNFINKTVKDISKINLITSLIIAFIFIIWRNNLAILLTLFYIIGIVFTNTILIISNENKTPDLSRIPSVSNIYVLFISYFKYLKTYFNKWNFIWIRELRKQEETRLIKLENETFKKLKEQKDIKLPKSLIYVPIINLAYLFCLKSRFRIHIINSIILTILWILLFLIFRDINISLLILFPIFYGTGYINRLWYKMPFIYDFYTILEKINNKRKNFFTKVKKIKNTKKEVTMKVWEKQETPKQEIQTETQKTENISSETENQEIQKIQEEK